MGTGYDKYINACRYLVMAAAVGGALFGIPREKYPLFIFFALLLVINTQVRIILGRKMFFIASVILDLPIVLYLFHTYTVFIAVMLLITLTDALLKLGTGAYALAGAATTAYAWTVWHAGSPETGFLLALFYSIAFLLLMQIRKELSSKTGVEALYDQISRNNYELESARARLVDYSRQVEQITKLEERNRISRELHDSIGHSLTGVLMQVDAALQLMEGNREKGMEVLRSAYGNINSAIEALRDTVRKLRPPGYQTQQSTLQELIEKFSAATGVQVEYKTSGIPRELFPSVETVLYRNVQEALTNAVRHGQADRVEVHIVFKPDAVEALISDNGKGCGEIRKGFGLSGMEERMDIVGGRISFRSEKGFHIRMSIPGRGL